ncbi:polymerase [Neosynechococcus sphagnicola sy1]|uniref:Polymerase n=2 Tax=Neosynechococcus TaxID=1501143 RepID=A0A098TGH8_9CYAN|nr:polymerase [Neosynechococcus sphagnicola sy1]
MNSLWQTLTLATIPLHQWRRTSYLYHLVGLLQRWRRSSWLMQWGDELGFCLLALVFGLAPFVPNALIGLLLFACGGYWALLTLSDETESPTIANRNGLTPIHLLILLYWGIATVATAVSPVKMAAFAGWSKLTLYLTAFALMARILRSPRWRSYLITVYLHISLIVSVYGIRQWIFGANALATWVDPESPLAKTTRVYSFLGNPNLLAGYLLPAIALSVAAIFAWRGWMPKLLAGVMAGINTACLVLTFSRGGWIGLVISMFVLFVLLMYWWSIRWPQPWRSLAIPTLLGGLAVFVFLAVMLVDPLRDRVFSIFAGRGDSSNNFRLNVWAAVIEMIRDRPILGIGPGNTAFNKIYPLFQRPRFNALSAYCILLEISVETGFVGLCAFLWLLTVIFNQGWVQLQRLRQLGSREGFWLMAAIATMAGMLGHGLVDTVWYRPEVSTLWWLMVAIIASYYTVPPRPESLAMPAALAS